MHTQLHLVCPTAKTMVPIDKRSGSLQDGTIVPSGLLSSQKGTPLLVHPMLRSRIGSPRDTATLGDRLCLLCHSRFATTISVFSLLCLPQHSFTLYTSKSESYSETNIFHWLLIGVINNSLMLLILHWLSIDYSFMLFIMHWLPIDYSILAFFIKIDKIPFLFSINQRELSFTASRTGARWS